MVHTKKEEAVWKIVKEIRKSYLSEQSDPKCQYSNTLLSDNDMKITDEKLSSYMKMKVKEGLYKNVTDKTLQTAAEMFMYLNICPKKHLNEFLKELTISASPRKILLALISVIKTTRNAAKIISTKIFIKAMEMFQLQNYKIIDTITKDKGFKECREEQDVLCMEALKVLGKIHFAFAEVQICT